MAKTARVGDKAQGTDVCVSPPQPATGEIVQGSSDVFVNGKKVARVGDEGITSFGNTFTIASGSSSASANGKQVARVGDPTTGCLDGTIVEGSPDHSTG